MSTSHSRRRLRKVCKLLILGWTEFWRGTGGFLERPALGREWKDLAGCKNRRGRDIGYALAADSCEEASSVDACTIAAPDAITAFAVPNPNCSSQSQSVFSGMVARQVSSPSGSPSLLQTSPMLLAPILSADVTSDHRTGDTGSQCRFLVHFADGKRTLHVPFGGKEKACGEKCRRLERFWYFSAGEFLLLAKIDAARRAALGSAESANVQIQLQESSAESVSVHSQHWGSLRLVPIGVAKDSENELLSKFSDSFGIADSCPIHLQHYGIKFGASRK